VASGISRTALPSNQCPRKSLSEEILHAVDEILWPANLFGKAGADLNLFFWQSSGKCLVLEDVHPREPKKVWVTCLDPHFWWVTEAGSLASGTAKVKKSLKGSHLTTEQSSRVLSF